MYSLAVESPVVVVPKLDNATLLSKVGSIARLMRESSRLSIPPKKVVEDTRRVSADADGCCGLLFDDELFALLPLADAGAAVVDDSLATVVPATEDAVPLLVADAAAKLFFS